MSSRFEILQQFAEEQAPAMVGLSATAPSDEPGQQLPDDVAAALFAVTYALFVDLLIEAAKSQLTKAERAVLEESLLEQYGRWALTFAKQRQEDWEAQERQFTASESSLITHVRQIRDEQHCSIIDAYTAYLLQWETLKGLQRDILIQYLEMKRDLLEGAGLPDQRGVPDILRGILESPTAS